MMRRLAPTGSCTEPEIPLFSGISSSATASAISTGDGEGDHMPDITPEAAKAFVDATLKQSELLGSWSLAVFGGCVALIAWYVQRRLDNKGTTLKCVSLVLWCAAAQGVSILLMYFAYGIMVNIIPELQFAKPESAEAFRQFLKDVGFNGVRYLFVAQFCTFFGGVVLLFIFGISNRKLV
jgi:hypothetical protein